MRHLIRCCWMVRQDWLLIRSIIRCCSLTGRVIVAHICDWPLDLVRVRGHCLLGETSRVIRLVMAWFAFRHDFRFEFVLSGLFFDLRFLILKLVIGLHWGAVVCGRRNRFNTLHQTSPKVTAVLLLILCLLKLEQVVNDRWRSWHLMVGQNA